MRRPLAQSARTVAGGGCILIRVFTDDDFENTLKGRGSPPATVDAEALKYGEQMGLETPVVHTLNYERQLYLETTIARLKLKEIDGNPYQRWNMWLNLIVRQKSYRRS